MRHNYVLASDDRSDDKRLHRVSRSALDSFLREPNTHDAVQENSAALENLRARLWAEPSQAKEPLGENNISPLSERVTQNKLPKKNDLETTLAEIVARQKALAKERLEPQKNNSSLPSAPQAKDVTAPHKNSASNNFPLQPNGLPQPLGTPLQNIQMIQNELQRDIYSLAERLARTVPAQGGGNGGGGGNGCSPEQIAQFNRQLNEITSSLQTLKTVNYGGLESKIEQLHMQLQQPIKTVGDMQQDWQLREDVQRIATRLEDISQLNSVQTSDFVHALEDKIERLAQVVSQNLQTSPNSFLPLARKVEALETKQAQNMASLEQLLTDVVNKIEHQPTTSQDINVFEGLITKLAQKIENTDKRFDSFEHSLKNVMQLIEKTGHTTAAPSPMQEEQMAAVQTTLDRLMEKLQPQTQALHNQVQLKERASANQAPQAYVDTTRVSQQPLHYAPTQPANIQPLPATQPQSKTNYLRGFVPQSPQDDSPLEIGAGSPRARIGKAIPTQRETMPSVKSDFMSSAKRLAQSQASEPVNANRPHIKGQQQEVEKSLGLFEGKKKKILISLASLLVMLAGLKIGYDFLSKPSPKERPSTQKEMPIKPAENGWKKAPLSDQPPTPQKNSDIMPLSPNPSYTSAPPQGVDPIVTGTTAPKLARPGVTLSTGWSPVIPTTQEKALTVIPASLKRAAELGNPSAQYELGNRHAEGIGAPKNFSESFRFYKAAADGGLALAQFRLAGIYEKGSFGERDIASAITYYGKAAKQGHVMAMYNLGVLLASPAGGGDSRLASFWFKNAAENGLVDAQFNLAAQYIKGNGVDKSYYEAYKWFSIAGNAGDKDSAAQAEKLSKTLSQEDIARAKPQIAGFTPRAEAASATRYEMPENGWGDNISAKPKTQAGV